MRTRLPSTQAYAIGRDYAQRERSLIVLFFNFNLGAHLTLRQLGSEN